MIKKAIKPFLLTLAIGGMVLLLQNCRKDKEGCSNENTVKDYRIYEEDLHKLPYHGYESLIFVNTSTGDTHTFVGDGWHQYWGLTTNQADYCPQKERYEMRMLTLRSSTFSKPITVGIYVDVSKYPFFSVAFQNTLFSDYFWDIGKPYDIDSLNISGVNYNGIEFLPASDNHSSVAYKCYYNEQAGIVRLFLKNGETWDLLK